MRKSDLSADPSSQPAARRVIDRISYDPARGLVFSARPGGAAVAAGIPGELPMVLDYPDGPVEARAVRTGAAGPGEWVLALPRTDAALCAIRCDLPPELFFKPDAAQFLKSIFPRNDAELERTFTRKVNRFGTGGLQYFVARQISDHFPGRPAYRVGSAVVMAYKAIEADAPEMQLEARDHVIRQLATNEACEITAHPRTNREHLAVSLLCAKWHLELSLGRREDFLATLERCMACRSGLSNAFTPAFNLSASMLIYCILMLRQGRHDRAREVSREAVDLFKAAVADASDKVTLFQELRVSHRNTGFMLQACAARTQEPEDHATWLLASLRVRGPAAERLKDAALAMDAGAAEP